MIFFTQSDKSFPLPIDFTADLEYTNESSYIYEAVSKQTAQISAQHIAMQHKTAALQRPLARTKGRPRRLFGK
jgi:hypothetical protein